MNPVSPQPVPSRQGEPSGRAWYLSRGFNRRLTLFGVGLNLSGLAVLALIITSNHNQRSDPQTGVKLEAPDTVAEATAPLPERVAPRTPPPAQQVQEAPSAPPTVIPSAAAVKRAQPAPPVQNAAPAKPAPATPPPPQVTPPATPAPIAAPPSTATAKPIEPSVPEPDARLPALVGGTPSASTAAPSATTARPRPPAVVSKPPVSEPPPAPIQSTPTPQPPSNGATATSVPKVTPTAPPKTQGDSLHNQDSRAAAATGFSLQNQASTDTWSQTCGLIVDARTLEPRMKPSASPTILGLNGDIVWPPALLQRDADKLEADGMALFALDPNQAVDLIGPQRRITTVEAIVNAADTPRASDGDTVYVSAEDENTIRSLDPRCRVVFVR